MAVSSALTNCRSHIQSFVNSGCEIAAGCWQSSCKFSAKVKRKCPPDKHELHAGCSRVENVTGINWVRAGAGKETVERIPPWWENWTLKSRGVSNFLTINHTFVLSSYIFLSSILFSPSFFIPSFFSSPFSPFFISFFLFTFFLLSFLSFFFLFFFLSPFLPFFLSSFWLILSFTTSFKGRNNLLSCRPLLRKRDSHIAPPQSWRNWRVGNQFEKEMCLSFEARRGLHARVVDRGFKLWLTWWQILWN